MISLLFPLLVLGVVQPNDIVKSRHWYIHVYTTFIVLQTFYKPQTDSTKLTKNNITSRINNQLVFHETPISFCCTCDQTLHGHHPSAFVALNMFKLSLINQPFFPNKFNNCTGTQFIYILCEGFITCSLYLLQG